MPGSFHRDAWGERGARAGPGSAPLGSALRAGETLKSRTEQPGYNNGLRRWTWKRGSFFFSFSPPFYS